MSDTNGSKFEEIADIPEVTLEIDELEPLSHGIKEEQESVNGQFETITENVAMGKDVGKQIIDEHPVDSTAATEIEHERKDNVKELDLSDIGAIDLREAEAIAREDILFLSEDDLLEDFRELEGSEEIEYESEREKEPQVRIIEREVPAQIIHPGTATKAAAASSNKPDGAEKLRSNPLPSENVMDDFFNSSGKAMTVPIEPVFSEKDELKPDRGEKIIEKEIREGDNQKHGEPELEKTEKIETDINEEVIDTSDWDETQSIESTSTEESEEIEEFEYLDIDEEALLGPEQENTVKFSAEEQLINPLPKAKDFIQGPRTKEENDIIDVLDIFWEKNTGEEEIIHDDDFIQEGDIIWDDPIKPQDRVPVQTSKERISPEITQTVPEPVKEDKAIPVLRSQSPDLETASAETDVVPELPDSILPDTADPLYGAESTKAQEDIYSMSDDELQFVEGSLLSDEYQDADLEEIYDMVRGEFGSFNPSRDIAKECTYFLAHDNSLLENEKRSIEDDLSTSNALVYEENMDILREEYGHTHGEVPESDFDTSGEILENITDKIVIIEDELDVDRFVRQLPESKSGDMKRLLKYLDGLFEKLPEETVRKFASSEYFDLYIKVLNDIGN